MNKTLLLPFLGALLCISCAPPPNGASSSSAPNMQPAAQNAPATQAVPRSMQATGAFDYYLLTLSWAPEFCHSKPDAAECGEHVGFIVHGLWPQYSRGGYPEDCGSAPGPTNPQEWLDLVPDVGLINHEWTKHGTCTGLTADNYFALIRKIRNTVKIPQDLVAPQRQLTMSPDEIKQDFEQANPGLNGSEIAVSCGSAPYLVGVEMCFSKDGRPIPCGSGIRDCNRPELRIPRVQ